MVDKEQTTAVPDDPDRRGGAAAAAVTLPGLQPTEVDESQPLSFATAWWWNTGVQFIMNPTLGTLRVLNQETDDSIEVGSAGAGLVQWFLPWCVNYDEVASNSLVFRMLLPGETGQGTRIFSIFQDYRSDTAMWLPAGVTDFLMREPIELVPGSGNFLPAASRINLKVAVVQPNNRLVPAADIVTP
jgi:hypothetical protein